MEEEYVKLRYRTAHDLQREETFHISRAKSIELRNEDIFEIDLSPLAAFDNIERISRPKALWDPLYQNADINLNIKQGYFGYLYVDSLNDQLLL